MVDATDFDPDKDAARIETAIKTKGEQSFMLPLAVFLVPVKQNLWS